ncbi:MAG: TonB family protein [Acidobacteriota bacterium]
MAASTLGCVLCLTISLAAVPVAAQSLGHLAAEEAARRKAIPTPARVITDDDLRPATGPTQAPLPLPEPTSADEPKPAARVAVAPARFASGQMPQIPILAVSGGEVVLEVSVNRNGRVTAVKPLRHTAPFTDAMAAAVRSWTFAPAEDAVAPLAGAEPDPETRKPMDSTVLVVGVFRPPALFANTLGEPPKNVAKPSGATPFPMSPLEMPAYPAQSLDSGVVLMELSVAAQGNISGAKVLKSTPPFDAPALAAVSALSFAPARVHNRPAPALVYVVAAFRQPIT